MLKPDEDKLTRNIVVIASNQGRYGYRPVTVMLNDSGMAVGKDRVLRVCSDATQWESMKVNVPAQRLHRSWAACVPVLEW